MSLHRWPVHPRPLEGELLSSWLRRIAQVYGLSSVELMQDLGIRKADRALIDIRPSKKILAKIAGCTGESLERVSATTFDGVMPFLFHRAEARQIHDASVLISGRQHLHDGLFGCQPKLADWINWSHPGRHRMYGCRQCLSDYPNAGVMLPWQLTIVLSCHIHGLMLEPMGTMKDSVKWFNGKIAEAPEVVRSMDNRTWAALTKGIVELPGGEVDTGDWFSVLRAIDFELQTDVWFDSELEKQLNRIRAIAEGMQTDYQPSDPLYVIRARAFQMATAIDRVERGIFQAAGYHATLFKLREPNNSKQRPEECAVENVKT
ncbi:MAG: TniQ family protein [Candidatus Obscuribacterales bacterium]